MAMSRMMVGFPIFLMLIFFIGFEVDANPLEECGNRLKFNYTDLDSVVKIVNERQLNAFCSNMTIFFQCIDNAFQQETGMTLEEMSNLFAGTKVGLALRLLVNIEDLVEELCTEGSDLRRDYLATAECLAGIDEPSAKECKAQSEVAFNNFNEVQTTSETDQLYKACIVAAYQIGCIGAKVKGECGEQGYDFFKGVIRKLGIFKIGMCPSDVMDIMKTSFIDSLTVSDSDKSVYRAVLELKKRRK